MWARCQAFKFYLFIYAKFYVFIYLSFCLLRAAPLAYGCSQARGLIGAGAAGLHHSHSDARSELCLQPTPQLMAMLDP